MRTVDIIQKKRDGQVLTHQEIEWFIKNYTTGEIPDYQASALLMAIYLKGMTREETVTLTMAMAHSGDMLDLSDIVDYALDKHSSGGVGDKTSLVVLPIVSALGIPVAKMSGRGLGFSGGTLDKLEAIAGFNVSISEEQFRTQAKSIGLVLAGQTAVLAPADGKLYALRDVTGTVDSLPLIAASIMSKKLAAGANGIVLDVKAGVGAFMRDVEHARELAKIMVEIGEDAGRDVIALISDMNQPLGYAVGNALEVKEAVRALHGEGVHDFMEHCIEVSSYMLSLAGRGSKWLDSQERRQAIEETLSSGAAFAKFREMVLAQGGDARMVDDPSLLPLAPIREEIYIPQSGFVAEIAADQVAMAALALGAGRAKKEDMIDPSVGVEVFVKVGDSVIEGQLFACIHANSEQLLHKAKADLYQALKIRQELVDPLPLFYGVIDGRA